MPKVLAADIGATNARFALYETGAKGLCTLREETFSSQSGSFMSALQQIREHWDEALSGLDGIGVAAAGLLQDGCIRMTNAAFSVEAREIQALFPKVNVELMNDFEAQARGLAAPGCEKSLKTLYVAQAPWKSSVSAIIGAGTGFGAAWLLEGDCPQAMTSEFGRTPLAFETTESDLARYFEQRHAGTPVVVEHLLSGQGLSDLHAYLTGNREDPSVFTRQEGFPESQTSAIFARFYARATRTAALAVLPQRIVIGGGLARKSPSLVEHDNFLSEFFRAESKHLEYLKRVNIFVDTRGELGLWGAALKALTTKE